MINDAGTGGSDNASDRASKAPVVEDEGRKPKRRKKVKEEHGEEETPKKKKKKSSRKTAAAETPAPVEVSNFGIQTPQPTPALRSNGPTEDNYEPRDATPDNEINSSSRLVLPSCETQAECAIVKEEPRVEEITPSKEFSGRISPGWFRNERQPAPDIYRPFSPPLPPLGRLNGVYDIDFENSRSDTIVLSVQESRMWGGFHFGDVRGAFYLSQRPYHALEKESFDFEFRGITRDNIVRRGPGCTGKISFLGNGVIRGNSQLLVPGQLMGAFRGHKRFESSQRRPPRSPNSLKAEFESYLTRAR
ncbi:hypothetical protein AJ79_04440 [Helicocarpus griseus UAMH5409]|uniref:Uncharacterized protein n=1 Tax=Helicocarpus griseus UAMH5409 TaxID=1447875 RepID=A0A2B7XSF1_9EURO|nr:hypothetical protein AJ79_04440 [Helicocarpus griseus UAMH5409]